jgi:hypothetical protein
MTTFYKTMLGFGILVMVGVLFAVLLLAVRKGQKSSPDTTPREFSSPTCPKCGTQVTEGKPCPKCGPSVG